MTQPFLLFAKKSTIFATIILKNNTTMAKNLINAQVPEAELAKIQEKLRELR